MAGDLVKPKIFKCIGCGASLSITALGYTTTVVCSYCNVIIDATSPLMKLIGNFNSAFNYQPYFELGTFGVLRGVKWKILGFVVREDMLSQFQWEEYLLYNPYHGFRWLLKIDGHFSITSRLSCIPYSSDKGATNLEFNFENRPYRLFNKGSVQVLHVVGEFYWRVKQNDKVSMRDFVSAPYMISEEWAKGEDINFSISEYILESEVTHAFKVSDKAKSSYPVDVAANQPNPNQLHGSTWMTMFSSLAVLIALWIVLGLWHKEKIVVQTSVTGINAANNISSAAFGNGSVPVVQPGSKGVVSNSFEVPDGIGNLELRMFAPVSNQWAETQVTLVNETTGDDYSFEEGVEYYFGSDSDGAWSEGSQSSSRVISSVPGGRYHIESEVTGNMPQPKADLTLVRHGSMGANFILAFLLLLVPPIWGSWRARLFEISRWSNSDYNPYPIQGEFDDDDD